MRKLIILTALFVALSQLAFAAPADPDSLGEVESPWSGGMEMAATNNYLWRGMTVNEAAILQPAAWLTYQNITFSLWSSWTLGDPKEDIKRNEIDAALTYDFEVKNFSVETYFNYYHYIDQPDAPSTGEVACIVGYPLGIVTVKAAAMFDVVEYPGAVYLEQGLEIEKEINDQLGVAGALSLGSGLKKFNEAYFEMDKPMTYLVSVDGRLTYSFANGIYAQPYFQFNKILNNDLKIYLKDHTSSVGIIFGKEF
jgi:hypothetical protein